MKEGINLARPYQRQSLSLEKFFPFFLNTKPLVGLNLFLISFLIFLVVVYVGLTLLQKGVQNERAKLLNQLTGLKNQEKVVLTAIQRQKDLELIKGQKKDFLPTINLIRTNLPEDTQLTDLEINLEKARIFAKTPQGLSFAHFISNLIATKMCRELSLTQSSFVSKLELYEFGLECSFKL